MADIEILRQMCEKMRKNIKEVGRDKLREQYREAYTDLLKRIRMLSEKVWRFSIFDDEEPWTVDMTEEKTEYFNTALSEFTKIQQLAFDKFNEDFDVDKFLLAAEGANIYLKEVKGKVEGDLT